MNEMSYAQMREKFEEVFYKEVDKNYEVLNNEKRKLFKQFIFNEILYFIVFTIIYITFVHLIMPYTIRNSTTKEDMVFFFSVGYFCLLVGVYWYPIDEYKKIFENKLKRIVMPVLKNIFGDLRWVQVSSNKDKYIYKKIGLLPDYKRICVDDCFMGSYKGVSFTIEDLRLDAWVKRITNLANKCVIIRLQMNKNFKSHTIINSFVSRGRNNTKTNVEPTPPRKDLNLHTIKLEDVDFMNNYIVYSNDEVESRYLITPVFMERIDFIRNIYKSKNISICFYDSKMYIALFANRDMFSIGSIGSKFFDYKELGIMFQQIYSIIELINYFKLDQRIGL